MKVFYRHLSIGSCIGSCDRMSIKIDNVSSELSHLSDSTRDSTRDPCPVTGSIRLK